MITKWEDLVGKTITGTYYHSGGVVLLLEDEFAVIVGKEGYYDEGPTADLADLEGQDTLEAAVAAEAPGAQQLLETCQARRVAKVEAQERRRLKYLADKYKETD